MTILDRVLAKFWVRQWMQVSSNRNASTDNVPTLTCVKYSRCPVLGHTPRAPRTHRCAFRSLQSSTPHPHTQTSPQRVRRCMPGDAPGARPPWHLGGNKRTVEALSMLWCSSAKMDVSPTTKRGCAALDRVTGVVGERGGAEHVVPIPRERLGHGESNGGVR